MKNESDLRRLPAVHALLQDPALAAEQERFGREAVTQAARHALDQARQALRTGGPVLEPAELLAAIRARLAQRPTLFRPVINATGVILHTNLGRAPIPAAAWAAMQQAAGCCDLELDLSTGKRASRLRGVEAPLVQLTGAEAGLVVNNNAAAVLLAVTAIAGKQPTAISRRHLVEIGGGFRLPEIIEASGSPLLEVGTTNRTHLEDFAAAIRTGAAVILLVHRSNFVMSGYVTEPDAAEVIALAHEHQVPAILDLGSGALRDPGAAGTVAELTVQKAVALGFDAVCFSGDKLLGGPQAGFVVGRRPTIERLRLHPLARAVRCDKVQLAGCVATLELYRRGEAETQIPVWQALKATASELRQRAEAWQATLNCGEVIEADDAVGGGSVPEGRLAGYALAMTTTDPDALLARLRRQDPPVIAHIDSGRVLVHPRTVATEHDAALLSALGAALSHD